GAVEEPAEETEGRAEHALVAELEAQAAPSPEIEELCEDIRRVIRERRPPDEDALAEADPEASAREAGGQLEVTVEGATESVQSNYSGIEQPAEGAPALTPEAIEDPERRVETPDLAADRATPDAVPPENVSLDADVEAARTRAQEAGLDTPAARVVAEQGTDASNPVHQAAAAQGELEETAQRGPEAVLAEQQAALGRASADLEALQLQAAQALAASRERTVEDNRGRQDGMVESEEATRARVSREAQQIFDTTRTTVMAMIEPLPGRAMSRWDAGVQVLSTEFRSSLDEVQRWIDERHSGIGGALLSVGDAVFGLPGWVTRAYDRAEQTFGDGVCELIREISRDVNSVIAAAEALLADARRRIDELFTNLGPELDTWAAEQRAAFGERLDALGTQVRDTQRSFTRDLRGRAAQAVDEVRAQIHQLRQAAGGLLGRIADAISRFVDDPAKFIIEGLLQILGIPPASFWAVVRRIGEVIDQIADDPEAFANNLLAALAQGFQQFFDHIGTHLLNGLLRWLFQGLGSVGVTIPTDLSLRSVITFFLQLMGITWPRIRQILARHVGEQNVALIEQAWQVISTLIERGPEGIFELIQQQLDPQAILSSILDAAIEYLTEALITRVTARILMMFNPAGAIIQAIEAIYRVLRWIFENAARIFSLVETVVNGISDILAGNIGGMANAIETALAGLIPPVIDFLAGYLGLGGLPDAVASAVRGLQASVERILDRVIGFIATRARALLGRGGLGRPEQARPGDGHFDGQVGKQVAFSGGGESHRLWVEMRGDDATVMVASSRQNVLTFLRGAEVTAAFPDEGERARVVGQAISMAEETELDAEAVQRLIADATAQSATAPSTVEARDDELEQEEQTLAGLLAIIFTRIGASSGSEELLRLRVRVQANRERAARLDTRARRESRLGPIRSRIATLAEEIDLIRDYIDDEQAMRSQADEIDSQESALGALEAEAERLSPEPEPAPEPAPAPARVVTPAEAAARLAAIGPVARAEIAALPGGAELLAEHDNVARTPDQRARSIRQEASVALELQRGAAARPEDTVANVRRGVDTAGETVPQGGRRATELDVETTGAQGIAGRQIDVKGADMSRRESLSADSREAIRVQVRIARRRGTTPVLRFVTAPSAQVRREIEGLGAVVEVGVDESQIVD
ncbi:hypothetical protein L6R52_36955, partial [Myxococcota bacterium]|nr:hypothetical protein [Myxococcota bacterium]